jgi:hypothetical protein
MALPAGGVALCWLLAMTLLLPPLDFARSYRSVVERIAKHIPRQAHVCASGVPRSLVAALEYHGGYRVAAASSRGSTACEYLLQPGSRPAPGSEWQLVARERRGRSDDERTAIYRRR